MLDPVWGYQSLRVELWTMYFKFLYNIFCRIALRIAGYKSGCLPALIFRSEKRGKPRLLYLVEKALSCC